MIRRLALLSLLLLAACAPPAPTPTPTPDLSHYTPWPAVTLTPGTRPSPPDNRPSPTPEPYPQLQDETATPQPYPVETREGMDIEPVEVEVVLPRLGVAAALGGGLVPCDGRTWQMAWSAAWYYNRDCEEVEHVPMLSPGPHRWEPGQAASTAARKPHSYWLFGNECEHEGQCNEKPEVVAEFYHDTILPWIVANDPEAKVIVGGVNAGTCGIAWLEQFVTYYEASYGPLPRAGFHFHPYADIWAGSDCTHPWQWNIPATLEIEALWQAWLHQADNVKAFMLAYGRPGDEVWYTEAGCLAPLPACQQSAPILASRIVAWLNGDGRFVDRAAWYSDWDQNWWHYTHLYATPPGEDGSGGTLSAVGEVWLNAELLPAVPMTFHYRYFPIIGYAADVVPPPTPAATPTPPSYPVPGDLHP